MHKVLFDMIFKRKTQAKKENLKVLLKKSQRKVEKIMLAIKAMT
jgi:hypothetical protein